MVEPLCVNYPHDPDTLQPSRISARGIGSVASSLRRQLGAIACGPRIDPLELVDRVRTVVVNGLPVRIEWELGCQVTDGAGTAVLGSCEYDYAAPDCVLAYIHKELIGDRTYLLRSSTIHELGHAIFDGPTWLAAMKRGATIGLGGAGDEFPYLRDDGIRDVVEPAGHTVSDWSEWRANEFMGQFLVQQDELQTVLLQHCRELGIRVFSDPQVHYRRQRTGTAHLVADLAGVGAGLRDAAIGKMATDFGVSPSFIQVRLVKYRFTNLNSSLLRSSAPIPSRYG